MTYRRSCSSSGQNNGQVNVKSFGAIGNGKIVTDAGSTNNSTTVTSATANFSAADVGKKVWGLPVAGGGSGVALKIPVGLILSVTNATTIVVSVSATGTASNLTLYYGIDDTTALQAAFAAALVTLSPVYIPAGVYLYKGQLGAWKSATYTPKVYGDGLELTRLVICPDFDWTPVALGESPFVSLNANITVFTDYRDFMLDGGGFDFHIPAAPYNIAVLECYGIEGCFVSNVYITQWGYSLDNSSYGQMFDFRSTGGIDVGRSAYLQGCHAFRCRGAGFDIYNSVATFVECHSQECGSSNFVIESGTLFKDIGSNFADASDGQLRGGQNIITGSGTLANFFGTKFRGQTDLTDVHIKSSAQAKFFGCAINESAAGNATGLAIDSGCSAWVSGTKISGFGSGHYIDNSGTLYDMGANTYSGSYSGTKSVVLFQNLPTSDPHIVGQVWSNSGVLTLSAG